MHRISQRYYDSFRLAADIAFMPYSPSMMLFFDMMIAFSFYFLLSSSAVVSSFFFFIYFLQIFYFYVTLPDAYNSCSPSMIALSSPVYFHFAPAPVLVVSPSKGRRHANVFPMRSFASSCRRPGNAAGHWVYDTPSTRGQQHVICHPYGEGTAK